MAFNEIEIYRNKEQISLRVAQRLRQMNLLKDETPETLLSVEAQVRWILNDLEFEEKRIMQRHFGIKP